MSWQAVGDEATDDSRNPIEKKLVCKAWIFSPGVVILHHDVSLEGNIRITG